LDQKQDNDATVEQDCHVAGQEGGRAVQNFESQLGEKMVSSTEVQAL
jgi:hypothetical protein